MKIVLTSLSSSGTGKTSNFAQIAYAVGLAGFTVKIIELDSRNSMNKCLGLSSVEPNKSTSIIFEENFDGNYPFVPVWEDHLYGGVQILQVDRKEQPKTAALLTSQPFGTLTLKKVLKKFPVEADLLILDCPGEQNVLSDSAVLSATHLLLGIECSRKCFEDVASFLSHVYDLKNEWEFPIPTLSGFLVGKFDSRAAYQREAFKDLVFEAQRYCCNLFNPIRYSPHYLTSYNAGLPINVYAPTFDGYKDFTVDGNYFRRDAKLLDGYDESFQDLPAIVPYLIRILRNNFSAEGGAEGTRQRTAGFQSPLPPSQPQALPYGSKAAIVPQSGTLPPSGAVGRERLTGNSQLQTINQHLDSAVEVV